MEAAKTFVQRPSRLGVVREHEIMRVVGTLGGSDSSASADLARREVLKWAQNRSGGKLPEEAWQFQSFEYLAGGRNSAGIRIQYESSDIWAIRADDPDKFVPGRVWTTEVVVGLDGRAAHFSARLLASTNEQDLNIEPHAPGFVLQLISSLGLSRGGLDMEVEPWRIERESEMAHLLDVMASPDRDVPVFVLTVAEGAAGPNVDAAALARATAGIAIVAIVPDALTWRIRDRFQRPRAVFNGAARAYLPGFNENARPFEHRLARPEELYTREDQARSLRWMRILAARESIFRSRLGHRVLSFTGIRNASLRARQIHLSDEGASDSEQLAAAGARIEALEGEVADTQAMLDFFSESTQEAEERAANAEAQLRASAYRIDQLLQQISALGAPAEQIELPASWADFAGWCDVALAGRVALASAARRGVRDPEFEDVGLAARCLLWLATEYRQGRIDGASGDFRDYVIEAGVRNSRCGNDEFEFDWQRRRMTADWHIKDSSGTRDPKRCLRIYYVWEPETQQVVIADMPSHRRSAVS